MSCSFLSSTVNQDQEKGTTTASTSTAAGVISTQGEDKVKQSRGYSKPSTILEVLDSDGRFSKFLKILLSSGGSFQDDLSDPRNQTTLFAPTDDAFDDFNNRYDLSHDELQRILKYHIIPDIIDEEDIKNSDAVATLLNTPELLNEPQRILIERVGSRLYLNYGVKVSEANIEARNGIIHVVNHVLELPKSIPAQLKRYSEFSLFLKAIEISGLENEFNEPGLTVFVPNNFAFKSLGQAAVDYLLSPKGRKDLRFILLTHISPELIYAGDLKLPTDGRDIRDHDQCNRNDFDEDFNERLSNQKVNHDTRRNEGNFPHQRGNHNDFDERASRSNGQRGWDNGLISHSQKHDRYDNKYDSHSSKDKTRAPSSLHSGKQKPPQKDESNITRRLDREDVVYDNNYDGYSVDYPSWIHGDRLALRVLTDYKTRIGITVNRQARVIMADGIAENGVIHVIDRVLLPPDLILPQLHWHQFDREKDCY